MIVFSAETSGNSRKKFFAETRVVCTRIVRIVVLNTSVFFFGDWTTIKRVSEAFMKGQNHSLNLQRVDFHKWDPKQSNAIFDEYRYLKLTTYLVIPGMIRDSQTPHEAAWFYCLSSSAYLPAFILGLFLSKAYLFAGHNSYLPAYAFLIFAELLKYAYIQLVYHKDSTYSPKQGFKLFSILFYFMKQVKLMELLRNLLMLAGYTSVVFVIAVCFGAEVLSKHEETLMFSCLITVVTIFPVTLHQGLPSVIQFMNGTFSSDSFTQVLLRNIQFTILGAWLGTFVIPLDWDREWQVWPIPCSFGALLGFAFSHLFSLAEMWTKTSGRFGKLSSKYR